MTEVIYEPDPEILYSIWIQEERTDYRNETAWYLTEPGYDNTEQGIEAAKMAADAMAAQGRKVRVIKQRKGVYTA